MITPRQTAVAAVATTALLMAGLPLRPMPPAPAPVSQSAPVPAPSRPAPVAPAPAVGGSTAAKPVPSGSAATAAVTAAAKARPLPPKVHVGAELMITDPKVIDDPVRTSTGAWSFGHLMTAMAGSQDPAAFTMHWLQLWEEDQIVQGQLSAARPAIREQIIAPWLEKSGGEKLDLDLAPFKLLAIVNRMDLRVHDSAGNVSTGGEGRFVFGALRPDGTPLPPIAGPAPGGFLVIFEYELPATSMTELASWANGWHDLGRHPIGSRDYNTALERLTRRFTDAGRAPGKANGSALNQIRTNEVALSSPWELREFTINRTSGLLTQGPVALTPGTLEVNGTDVLASLVNDNEIAILNGTFRLPGEFSGASSLSGPFTAADFPDFASRTFTVNTLFEEFVNIPWSAEGIRSNEARHKFALNTCNGCHRDETATDFIMVGFPADHQLPGRLGVSAQLAGFLTGVDAVDPVDGTTSRHFGDLARRKADLTALLTSFAPAADGRPGRGPQQRNNPRFVH